MVYLKQMLPVLICAVVIVMDLGTMFERLDKKKYYGAGFSGMLAIATSIYMADFLANLK